ncbi:hypothetical protein NBRC3280_0073 [Acetobacter pasteurianus NBRC 3280]|uniref:Autotransproter heptosyltransferase TibC/BAHTCr-like N-terminal domain-containing protein n=1 Tax=Acetobacter pasteurianus NBRC 3278 TaxID=1226660 RepID=A0A401WZS0_ACEPA|nr:hypothetical protein NBRC3277_0164 [Acetobacter pasteurianus NBRC 3277]GCD61060.1 hypothetical protein NBRC3278_0153 [Acetobacter pasteurianus NBRC 3278]GCD67438.1 hypothetical protein NBRC3280_0073 [Acetobacter pasteurianus NBRC 3280]
MTEQTTVTNTQANQSKPAQTPPYPTAAALPTQQAPKNIRFDFNEGCRVHLPLLEETEGTWRIELTDLDTGNILFAQAGLSQALVRSSKRWYVRFGITVWQDHTAEDGKVTSTQVFSHAYDSKDKQVLIIFPVGTLGDTLAWVPYATRFAEVRQARVTCAMSELLIPLFQNAYPHINFVTHDDVRTNKLTEQAYATYYLGLFFDDAACDWQPSDFRLVGIA